MKNILKLNFLFIITIVFGCSEYSTESDFKKIDTPVTRFLEYNRVSTDDGAYQEEYTILLPGLKEVSQPKKKFLIINRVDDTLKIVRRYWPENCEDIRITFFNNLTPKDIIGLLEDGGICINPDKINAKAEIPGITGMNGLRFDFDRRLIGFGDLREMDTLSIYHYYLDNGWELVQKMGHAEIMRAIKLYLQGTGNPSPASIDDPFSLSINKKNFLINIRKKKIIVNIY